MISKKEELMQNIFANHYKNILTDIDSNKLNVIEAQEIMAAITGCLLMNIVYSSHDGKELPKKECIYQRKEQYLKIFDEVLLRSINSLENDDFTIITLD